MPEFRHDPLLHCHVIVAASRETRPHDVPRPPDPPPEECPFCEGVENATPGELAADRPAASPKDGPGWRVRVVPNKYPAVQGGAGTGPQPFSGPEAMADPFAFPAFAATPSAGSHEVIIDCPRHVPGYEGMTLEETRAAVRMYASRLAAHRPSGAAWVSLFKNVGFQAGASLSHAHTQLIAVPFLPPTLRRELAALARYRRETGRDYWADWQRHEERDTRLIAECGDFLLVCPYASRFAYEAWITPRRQVAALDLEPKTRLMQLARLVRQMVRALREISPGAAYNLVFSAGPFQPDGHGTPKRASATMDTSDYRYRVELLPRVSHLAGFEFSSGCHINTVRPEEAAQRYRESFSQ